MKKVNAWKCDFCGRAFINPANGARHEERCRNNPKNRFCVTCIHGVWEPVCMRPSLGNYDEPENAYGPWCNHHNKAISDKPYFIDCDDRQICSAFEAYYYDHDPDDVFKAIPGTCHHYKYKGHAGWDRREGEASE